MNRRMSTMLAVAALMALATGTAAALPFAGSPIINYGQRFYIYSSAWNSYCKIDVAGGGNAVKCDVGLSTTAGAAKFYIGGGGCGPVPSSAVIKARINIDNGLWCYLYPPASIPKLILWCDQNGDPGPQYQISNINAVADGWLHGNATAVQFRSDVGGTNGWCSAQSSSDSSYVECNRATVSTWETFYFVPV